jgi:hypothetical protein
MYKKIFLLTAISSLLFLTGCFSQTPPELNISLEPNLLSVNSGDTFTINFNLESHEAQLENAEINLIFDEKLIQPTNNSNNPSALDISSNKSAKKLGTFEFQAIDRGSISFELKEKSITDANGKNFKLNLQENQIAISTSEIQRSIPAPF